MAGDSFCPQEAVAAYVLGIEGCAKFGGKLPVYQADESLPVKAWHAVGEILYLLNLEQKDSSEIKALWAGFSNGMELAVADVLYQLAHSRMGIQESRFDLVLLCAPQVKSILEGCLHERLSLPSIFQYGGSRDSSVIRFIINSLATIGDGNSKELLVEITEDPMFGKHATAAVEGINSRLHTQRMRVM